MVATFSRRIEGAAYVSSKAGAYVFPVSLISDDQAENEIFLGLAYRFHASEVNAAILFKC